jgi:hypothetical protein
MFNQYFEEFILKNDKKIFQVLLLTHRVKGARAVPLLTAYFILFTPYFLLHTFFSRPSRLSPQKGADLKGMPQHAPTFTDYRPLITDY